MTPCGIIKPRHESPFHHSRLPQEPGRLRVDAGHAGPVRPRDHGCRRDGRLPRRQYLRLHRPGARGIGPDDSRAGARERGGPRAGAHRDRVSHPALRRRDPERDPRGHGHPRHLRARPDRGSRQPGRRQAGLGHERAARLSLRLEDSAAADLEGALRVREDRRRLRHGLHLLRHPPVPGRPQEPDAPGHRGRGRGAGEAGHPGSHPRLPGHARLWPRAARQRRHRRSAPRAV